eukprot:698685-Prorocentrum_lima.AAC.1
MELDAGLSMAASCVRMRCAPCMLRVIHAGTTRVRREVARLMSRMQMMTMMPETRPLPWSVVLGNRSGAHGCTAGWCFHAQ